MAFVISGTRDNSGEWIHGPSIVSSRKTELWHIPHSFEPNKPICGSVLGGQLKRTKGIPNCNACTSRWQLTGFDSRYWQVLAAFYMGLPIPEYAEHYLNHDTLIESDLLALKGGKYTLTPRGEIVALDIVDTVGYYDTKTRLFHRRHRASVTTLCGIQFASTLDVVDEIAALHADHKKRGRHVPTCVRCMTWVDRYGQLDG